MRLRQGLRCGDVACVSALLQPRLGVRISGDLPPGRRTSYHVSLRISFHVSLRTARPIFLATVSLGCYALASVSLFPSVFIGTRTGLIFCTTATVITTGWRSAQNSQQLFTFVFLSSVLMCVHLKDRFDSWLGVLAMQLSGCTFPPKLDFTWWLSLKMSTSCHRGAWYGGAGKGDCMGLVEICLFVVLSIPLLVAHSIRVSFSLCHLEGIRWKYQYRTFEKYSTPQGSCGEKSAVTGFQDSLSIWLSDFLSSHFTVMLCFLHFLASSSERCLGDVLVRIPDKLGVSALRQYAVMDLSKAVQLSSA